MKDLETRHTPVARIAARAQAKTNLLLAVGALGADGYHPLTTVFHAVELANTVTLTAYSPRQVPWHRGDSRVLGLRVRGLHAHKVPNDSSNLAWRAVDLVTAELVQRGYDPSTLPAVVIEITKQVPTAGGMAGGSADGAAAIKAAAQLFADGLLAEERSTLLAMCAILGADVPFSFVGRTQLGTGRGDELVEMMVRGRYHWVMAAQSDGLSTPAVFRRFDEMTPPRDSLASVDVTAMAQALRSGDPAALAPLLHNDLQPAALSLMPKLHSVLDAGRSAGALAGIVSGSGPTCVFLCRDAQHAQDVAEELHDTGKAMVAVATSGPAAGATLVTEE
ncbi:4-(cytidine 5'-diphospho)-2-C-methyl-D-erythritol kinase [Corynebacterium choanae]|uniref:4-diphosphocytidyl-2-C-methyl-D-erythritol kinase n=1 Tax=Corynebacterium choanae TaxID=1862358 RepID=A0A3G6J5B8_9CORY|nr:4-(cytidine 5'-diphospho)-2-C-methyl-D-erythritol kinase [Corynebacterium choanae]AZA13129.1 4-diphosphocytidyl-2-C-methyl-D-erythritol kinase [Corynebacterium choanae]